MEPLGAVWVIIPVHTPSALVLALGAGAVVVVGAAVTPVLLLQKEAVAAVVEAAQAMLEAVVVLVVLEIPEAQVIPAILAVQQLPAHLTV
jgi:hypothetical protein